MSELDEYAKEHWKSVVLCKECKHRPIMDGDHEMPWYPKRYDMACPFLCSTGIHFFINKQEAINYLI